MASRDRAERTLARLKKELTGREEAHIPKPIGPSEDLRSGDSDDEGDTEPGTKVLKGRGGWKRTTSAKCAVKNIIANSSEKFMCFTVGHNTFVDSCLFLSASLAQLADTLSAVDKKITRMRFAETDEMEADMVGFSLMCQKGESSPMST